MKIGKRYTIAAFIIFFHFSAKSQALMEFHTIEKPDYCLKDSAESRSVLGKKVKIWHEGGIYTTLNESNRLTWPTDEMKSKAGKSSWDNYEPKTGDTGTVVHVFNNTGSNQNYIFLIRIKNNYIPLGCYYVTDPDQPDIHEQGAQNNRKDSIQNARYAAGCKFKMQNVNNRWNSRAGRMNIDIISEKFACDLIYKGIDTIMLCKHMFDNGSLPSEKAFVLWLDKGKGYIKAFFNNKEHRPTGNKIALFNSAKLLSYFFINKVDSIPDDPTSDIYVSHSMGYNIELYTPSFFFRERQTDYVIRADKSHPKSIWWTMVYDQLAKVKKE